MRDYFRRMYVVDRPYGEQKGFETARPETNVKSLTPVRKLESPVSYRPYESRSYNEMMYLFPGYEGIRNQWFDSKVGGQGEDEQENIYIYAHPFDGAVGYLSGVSGGAWSDTRDAAVGNQGEGLGLQTSYVRALRTAPLNSHAGIHRFFFGFYLPSTINRNIKDIKLKLTSAYESSITGKSICVQPSIRNPQFQLGNSDYSNFFGYPFIISRFFNGDNYLKFNNYGVNYIKKKIGEWVSFCIREYEHDYLNVDVDAGTSYYIYFKTANYPIKEKRPTLIFNY